MDFVREIPQECLTAGECAGVWSGWNTIGDREVVREASAKGTHICLAHKYLAYRRHCTIAEAKKYFSDEVEIWVDELLKKQQIHRASHILTNSGKTPLHFIREKCVRCREPKLRKYLANYVMTNGGFEGKYEESWSIMNSITLFEEKNGLELSLIEDRCIQEISLFPDNVKSALITELYFYTDEQYLSKKLRNTILWDYLLTNNKIDILVSWIDAIYEISEAVKEADEASLKSRFRELEIVDGMIEGVETSNATSSVKELVLNRLSRYGVFTKKERHDVKLTLARFFSDCATPSEFAEILCHERCSFGGENFVGKLFSILHYRSAAAATDLQEQGPQDRELLDSLTELCKNTNDNENLLQRGIIETVKRLSNDVEGFLTENPLIVLSLGFLEYLKKSRRRGSDTKNMDKALEIRDIFNNEDGINNGSVVITREVLRKSLVNLPYLSQSLDEDTRGNDITIYQLLNGYKNLDVQELFKWRFRKEPMPNFTSENLIAKYGRKEKLTYVYYLKEARPSMAAYVLQQHSKMRDGASSKTKYQAASYAHLFGLQHANDPEIMCSCVAFIEMLSVDSECLRLHATAADYIEKAMNISIYDLLESVSSKNQKDLGTILSYLESSFQTTLTLETLRDTEGFIETLKSWDFIARFARAHNTLPPCSFLKFLASNNLWFEFVLAGHVFAYPLEQIMESARHFENPSIREHLLLALSNTHILTTNSPHSNLAKTKSRELFLGAPRQSSVDQSSSSDESDLWLTILKCHQSQDPPGALLTASQSTKSPVLTVLAACYEPSATPAYCYSWLVISANMEELVSDYEECLKHQLWPTKRVSHLLRSMLSFEYVDTLSRGFQIFMPSNPLRAFFEFLVQCIYLGDFKHSREKLQDFVTGCSTLKSNKIIDWESTETDYLHNSYWIVTVAVECMMTALGKCFRSTHLQMKFLDVLVKCNINADLNVETPDFYTLWEITTILSNTRTSFDFSAIHVTEEGSNVNAEIKRCIRDLVDVQDFNSALQLSKVAGLHCSEIIIAQYRSEFKRSTNEDGKVESSFWKRCAQDLKKYNVSFEDAAAFFVEHAEKVLSHKEQYEILKLALQTLEPIMTDKQAIDTVEMAMWKSCILAGPDSIEIENEVGVFNKLKSELLFGVSDVQVTCTLNDTAEESAVEVLINRFVAAERLATALRISTIFNYKHRDLQILMLCLSLAEGEISPYQLTSQQKSLLSETGKVKQQKYTTLRNRGFRRRSSSSSLTLPSPHSASVSPSLDAPDTTSNFRIQQIQLESLSLVERLVKSLHNGFAIGMRILLCIKLATYLRRSYPSLLTLNDPMQLLYEVVGSTCDHKLEMVGDIIAAYRIKNDVVAKFLAEEIVANTPRLVEEGLEGAMVMWGYPLGVSIQAIIDLCIDPSLLGWELLKTANLSLGHSHGERRNVLTLKVVVELLIRSHDCFTASCNMEGIASVLRKSQHLAYTLQQLKHWSILVRLVTGLRRFTEMNYIFQILMENDQFEFLLGQGLNKIPGLKTALLEFSKRHCPENKELFTMIAVHFHLYNEMALMWENEARAVINELVADVRKNLSRTSSPQQVALKLTKNEATEKKLQEAMKNYTHVTDNYLQDNKLNLASRFSHQAQLVALQLSLLAGVAQNQQVACLFNLTPEEINRTMCQALSLPQTLILVQAYNHHGDWSAAVYAHVVINGEIRYLKDFLAYNRLTPAIVQECVCRYRSEKTITKQMTENMQMLVSELTDIECKYALASQLGFKKIIENMLANPATGSYLKDTVWKQGFNVKEQMGDGCRG